MDTSSAGDTGDSGTGRAARLLFGDRLPMAERFAELLSEQGVLRGLIGPREVERLWDRHMLNSVVFGELLPPDVGVIDVGSGAGLPGIPLAIARPDLRITLLEPMARRVTWLQEIVDELELDTRVVRGRAEEKSIRDRLDPHDAVVARAVAPMERLARWCLPLVRPGGHLLALKGAGASEELARDRQAVEAAGGGHAEVIACGEDVLDVPTNVVLVERMAVGESRPASARGRKDKSRTGKPRKRKDR